MTQPNDTRRGRFYAFEGGDGGGKTGAISRAAEWLRSQGIDVLTTCEPGGTPEGLALRSMLLAEAGHVWDPGAELLLMIAARVQHVKRVIEPALAAGRVILCDRYIGSTLAYQGAGRGISKDLILYLHRAFVGDVWPDLTIILDIDPAVGLRRSRARLASEQVDESRFEDLDLKFHQRVRQSFLDQAAANPGTSVVIDADRMPSEVQADVLRVLAADLNRVASWRPEVPKLPDPNRIPPSGGS